MFRLKKPKVSALKPTTKQSETGTVKKGKKKTSDKDTSDDEKGSKISNADKRINGHSSLATRSGVRFNGEDDLVTSNSVEPNINLSRDELLKLLSVFEGELQARDEVIAILKSECAQNTETRYGLTSQPLKALQRDAASLDLSSQDEVFEQTKDQLKKIIQHQKESYKKLKQMHLASEDKYQRTSLDLEEEKRKHQEYMLKSDDFVTLLEHDRERLKQLLEQEKSVHDRKERELIRKLKENKDDLSRLKTLSLELVEERQQQLQALNEQTQLATSRQQLVEELQAKITKVEELASSEREHAIQLENDLEEQNNKFYKDNEELTAKLSAEEVKSAQLEEKVESVSKQMKKLKCVDKNLRKTDDQLWKIKEKLEQEDNYDDLLEEVELLRKTVADMQEAEKIYVQAQEDCKELQTALQEEVTRTRSLRDEVEKLRKSTRNKTEMERCVEEANFRFDEMQQMFEAECKKANAMKIQIDEFSLRLNNVDETDATLQLSEAKLNQLNTLVTELREEKGGLETKLQLERDKSSQYKEMLEDEQSKVTKVTENMIEESKKVLKVKEKLASLETKRAEEVEALHRKVERAEQTMIHMITKEKAAQMENLINNLRKQVVMLKKRLDDLENESDKKNNEARLAKEEAEKAQSNLNISTEKLKKLVAMGLNEQLAIAKCEEIEKKRSSVEEANVILRKQVIALETRLKDYESTSNTNNNNTSLKGVSLPSTATLATSELSRDTEAKSLSCIVTKNAITNRSSIDQTSKTSVSNRALGGINLAKRDIHKDAPQNSSSWVKNSSKTTAASLKMPTTPSTYSSFAGSPAGNRSKIDVENRTEPLVVRLKGADERVRIGHSPVSMTICHDPSVEGTPTFRILRDTKTGTPHIETSMSDSKKGIQIRISNKLTDAPSTQNRPPTGGTPPRGSTKGPMTKIGTKTTAATSNSSKTRSESKTRKVGTVVRRASISPTRIPKLRSSTPTSTPTPNSPTVSRISRASPTNRLNR